MSNDFTVTTSPELMRLQILTQNLVVVYLSIDLKIITTFWSSIHDETYWEESNKEGIKREKYSDNDGLVLVIERLVSGGWVDDG